MIPLREKQNMGVADIKTIRLCNKHVRYLMNLPESGMGYQVVNIRLKSGRLLRNKVVLNSEFLLLENGDEISQGCIKQVEIATKKC